MEDSLLISDLKDLADKLEVINVGLLTNPMIRFITKLRAGDIVGAKSQINNELFDKLEMEEMRIIHEKLYQGSGSPWVWLESRGIDGRKA